MFAAAAVSLMSPELSVAVRHAPAAAAGLSLLQAVPNDNKNKPTIAVRAAYFMVETSFEIGVEPSIAANAIATREGLASGETVRKASFAS